MAVEVAGDRLARASSAEGHRDHDLDPDGVAVPDGGSGTTDPTTGAPSTSSARSRARSASGVRPVSRRPPDVDVVGDCPGTGGSRGSRPQSAGSAGSMREPVVLRPDAQDPLGDRHVVPGRRPGQPRVLGLAVGRRVAPGDHLGVDVRLAAMDLRDRLARRGVDPQVVVERARRRCPTIASAIITHGLVWQKMPAFSL